MTITIETLSSKNVIIECDYNYKKLTVALKAEIKDFVSTQNAYLTKEVPGRIGYFLFAGNTKGGNTVFAAISENNYKIVEDYYQQGKNTINKQKQTIIDNIDTEKIKVLKKIKEGDQWEGIPDTVYYEIEGIDCDANTINTILSETKKGKAKNKKLKEAKEARCKVEEERLKKAYSNGLCSKCDTYCFGDCQA